MGFKLGDTVRIIDDGYLYLYASHEAEKLGLTKWKAGYGEWPIGKNTGVCQHKTGVVINTASDSDLYGNTLVGVEIDNKEVQIVIGDKGLELVQDQKPVQTPQQNSSDPFSTLKEFLGV
jgi:hypothetical protein